MMMKKLVQYLAVLALLLAFVAGNNKPVRIFLAGDSTMADKAENKRPETGWGMVLPSYFDDNVVIENHARNGRSTRTFISEGRWDYLINRVSKGDYVFIQFGHNDQSVAKVDRYTPPADYKANLIKFVTEVRAKKAIPVLFTPVMRRKFDDKGNFVDQHGNYPNLVREVAKEMNVLLVDMTHSSMDLIIKFGPEGSKALFMNLAPGTSTNYPEGKEDNTHFVEQGAFVMAGLAIDEIKALDIKPLVKHLITPDSTKIKLTIALKDIENLGKQTNNKIDEGQNKAQ